MKNINKDNWHDHIIMYESGDLSDEMTIKLFQHMINDGHVWNLQGFYGRTAMDLIDSGLCTFGEEPRNGYWGQTFPSKYDLDFMEAGTDEYVSKRLELGEEDFFEYINELN